MNKKNNLSWLENILAKHLPHDKDKRQLILTDIKDNLQVSADSKKSTCFTSSMLITNIENNKMGREELLEYIFKHTNNALVDLIDGRFKHYKSMDISVVAVLLEENLLG